MLRFCSMHVVNLGILQYVLGSAVSLLAEVHGFFGPGKLPERLTEMTERFKRWASSCGITHSQGYITRGMLHHKKRGTEYPLLTLEAYNGRVFLPFICLCLRLLWQQTTDLEVGLAYYCCERLSAWMDGLERCPRYLSEAQADMLAGHALRFCEIYLKLVRLGLAKNVLRWHLVPKFHVYIRHLAQEVQALRYNPRFHHTYLDEDMMGTLKALCKRVHRSWMEPRVLGRWLLRLLVWKPR